MRDAAVSLPAVIVLKHNRNDSDVKKENKLLSSNRELAMKNIRSYRAMGSICRQRAVFDPQNCWKHLGDAERWEQLAAAEISDHFKECNTDCSSDLANAGEPSDVNGARWGTIVAA